LLVRIKVTVGLAYRNVRRKGSGPFPSRSFLASGNCTFAVGSVCSADCRRPASVARSSLLGRWRLFVRIHREQGGA